MNWIEWVGIEWTNPLIQLRVWLAFLWLVTAGYGAWALRSRRHPATKSLTVYSVLASVMGAASYFLGASTTFGSLTGFLVVGALLAATPVAVMLWIYNAGHDE